jgi:hypothetical protein
MIYNPWLLSLPMLGLGLSLWSFLVVFPGEILRLPTVTSTAAEKVTVLFILCLPNI